MTPTHAAGSSVHALRVLSLCMGVFFLFMGLDKAAWLGDPGLLTTQLRGWHDAAPAPSRWYLETVAIPGAPVFARLVPVGELAVGVALIAGFRVRLAAVAGLFMVLNFHFAMGVLLRYSYLWNGYGPPVLGGLLALAIGGARLPFSVMPRRAR
ncbi:MAG: DoxX family membrane protein [Vicinamibacteria bacterium]|nr:DoxX family membrane protein [Vicinamibacteria bacterium]